MPCTLLGMTSAGAVPTVLPTRFFGVTMPDPDRASTSIVFATAS
jgi:hypothetical protein